MTPVNQALQTYLLWQRERGQVWPVINPKLDRCMENPATPRIRLGFVCTTSSQAEKTLLDKMIAAMQLGAHNISFQVASSSVDLMLAEPEVLVFLGREDHDKVQLDFGSWQEIETPEGVVATISTYHPRELLQTPTLKRAAWTHLQEILVRLCNAK